ncbi:hypothetical protein SDC9_156197 [bioreactor metagenome]|uniref:Uncharacterized protein n=1 Tax=bioreactor metagenome TaxID=1076179 RepID=A0A645F655_9ZZZZ
MLCLGDQVGSYISGICPLICNYENFTGAGYHIYAHQTHDPLFRHRHINIARACYFVHLGYAFRSEGQGSYTLSTSDLEYFIRSCYGSSCKYRRLYFSISIRRCYHYYFIYACNLGRYSIHQNCRRISRAPAGNINAYPFYGPHQLAKYYIFPFINRIRVLYLFSMIFFNVFSGFCEVLQQSLACAIYSLFYLLPGYQKILQYNSVKFPGIFSQCSVLIPPYIG